jgi:hypothetical protein
MVLDLVIFLCAILRFYHIIYIYIYIYRPHAEWPGLRTRRVPFSFFGAERNYREVSHTCWNNAVISDTGSSWQTLKQSPSHSTLSVARIIRLYRNVDMDNRNMSMELRKYNLWHREWWVLRTCPGTTLSTTNSTLSGSGLTPGHSRERPATKRLSNGTANLKTSVIKFRTDLEFVYYTAWILDSAPLILRRMYLSEKWNCFVSRSSALS